MKSKRDMHPAVCEYGVRARWWRKGLLTACVWCGTIARCKAFGQIGGYYWEPVEK